MKTTWPHGGETAKLVGAHDWSLTPLGPVEGWPQSLKSLVEFVLASPFPSLLAWGPDLTVCAYNQPYRALLGDKPSALGRSMLEVWPEASDLIGPQLSAALAGEAAFLKDAPFRLKRDGASEDVWFDYAFTPVRNEKGEVAGVLSMAVETTTVIRGRGAPGRYDTEDERIARRLQENEARQDLLLRVLQAQRDAADPQAIMTATAEAAGRHLHVDRAGFFELTQGETATWLAGWSSGLPALSGAAPLSGIGEKHLAALRSGRTVVIADTATDPLTAGSALATSPVRAGIGAPVRRGGRWVAGFYVNQAENRGWTTDEAVFVREVADQTWDAVERARAEAALRASEARFREFAENSADTLYISEAVHRRLEYLSPAYEAMWGEPRDLILQRPERWFELLHPEDRDQAELTFNLITQGTATLDYRILRPSDGEVRWIRDTGFPIRDGDGVVRRVGGIAQDVTEVKRAEAELRDKEERLRVITEHVPQLVWTAVAEGDWTWCSRQWTDYTGRSLEDSRRWGWLEPVHPDDHDAVKQAWARAVKHGEYDLEYRIRRASDGVYRWFHTRATPLRNEGLHATEWFGTSTDVDDTRRLRDRQAVLVAELQHRTRNLLGVIRAVARQTRRASESLDDFEARFGERLAALGRVQGLLSRGDDRPVAMGDMLKLELAAHGADDDPRVALDGPGVDLPVRAVQTVALAIHELTTNALKHGALARPEGRLTVTWTVEGLNGSRRVSLRWREEGVPPAVGEDFSRRRGYGRELIERALPYELGARTEFGFVDGGVRCSIELPVADKESAVG